MSNQMGVEHFPKLRHSWNPTLPNDGLIYLANPQGLFWDGLGAGNSIRFPSNESINIYVFIYIYIYIYVLVYLYQYVYVCISVFIFIHRYIKTPMSGCLGATV